MERSIELKEADTDDEMILINDEEENGNRSSVLYTTCPEINIHVDSDRKRKITIIEDAPPVKYNRSRSASHRLRRSAIMNSAKDRQRSERRSKCRDRSRSRAPREHKKCEMLPIENYERASMRLPTDLSKPSVVGMRSKGDPGCINLPSPLYVLTEQQVTGVSEAKMVVFTTKILLTTRKLSLKERQNLYAEMVEAHVVGESRSSADLHEKESNETFESKIYYSSKGIYIHTVQNVMKISANRSSTNMQEKTYSNICKTRIIGEKGKFVDGFLNIQCIETIECKNQIYTRSEVFKIGLQTEKAEGLDYSHDYFLLARKNHEGTEKFCSVYQVTSEKKTFDPSMSIKFDERILFDRKNIGVTVNHKASADMTRHWDHEAGSFGEEQCEYREIPFVFGNGIEKTPMLAGVTNRGEHTPTKPAHRTSKQQTLNQMKEASFMKSPQATSTPKTKNENSPVSLHSTIAKPTLTPIGNVKSPKTVSKNSPASRSSPNEIDLDRSLRKSRKSAENKNDSSRFMTSMRNESQYVGGKSALSMTDPRNESAVTSANSSVQQKGHLRIKETRITKEIREETGKPAQVSEKKEESIKEREVALGTEESLMDPSATNSSSLSKSYNMSIVTDACKTGNGNQMITVEGPSPIKVSLGAEKPQTFSKMLTLEALINNKPTQINLKIDLLARTAPDVCIQSVKFDGKRLWEKSLEWSARSVDNSTSNTKTIAVQQSDIMKGGEVNTNLKK